MRRVVRRDQRALILGVPGDSVPGLWDSVGRMGIPLVDVLGLVAGLGWA